MLHFTIQRDQCIACGLCAQECPHQIIQVDEFPMIMDEHKCLRCQHCLAICPTGAISILGHDPQASSDCDPAVLASQLPSQQQMALLIKSRRTVRQFADQDVDPALLQELLDLAGHAPTGSNKRDVLVTVLDTRRTMNAFRNDVYAQLAHKAATDTLPEHPRQKFYATAAQHWKGQRIVDGQGGQDMIFRNAPHCLIISNGPTATCQREDALIYLSYFDLLAHSRGVGTVWCGILYWCLEDMLPEYKSRLGIPADHTLGYCMLFGMPAVNFARTVEQGPAQVNRPRWP